MKFNAGILLLLFFCQVSLLNATIIIDRLGPSDSFSSSAAMIGLVGDQELEQGFSFFVPSSNSYYLDTIEVAISASSQGNSHITFDLRSDSFGLPGTVLDSFTFSDIKNLFSTGVIYTAQSVLQPTLIAGQTYWLTASSPPGTRSFWHLAVVGDDVPRAQRWDFGSWNVNIDGDDPSTAFRISGTPVPEPATLSLLALGAFLAGRRRKTKA